MKLIKLDIESINSYMEKAVKMTKEDFEKIRWELDTPMFVYVIDTNQLLYNTYTCWSSYFYDGTCQCINHSPKSWAELIAYTEGGK